MEQNSASRIEQFHLEGGTKYNIFPKKWDFQNESGDFIKTKSATQSLLLIFGTKLGSCTGQIMKDMTTSITYRGKTGSN